MSKVTEFIGCRSTEALSCDVKGNPLYNMWLTDTEIIRCRDCKHCQLGDEGFYVCNRGWVVAYDEADGFDYKLHIEVDLDGFCAWAVRKMWARFVDSWHSIADDILLDWKLSRAKHARAVRRDG